MDEKQCVRCKEIKLLTEYSVDSKGIRMYCKKCLATEYREKYREKKGEENVGMNIFFEKGYQERIDKWMLEEVIPELNELWIKSKLYKL